MRALVLLLLFPFLLSTSTSFAQTTFSIEIVDSHGAPGCYPSLALESDGTPLIAYNDGAAILARKSGGLWSFETVAEQSDFLSTRSLALTSTGDPVVAIHYQFLAHVATRTGGIWSFQKFYGLDPWTMTLAIDHNDGAHMVNVWSWGSGLYSGFIDYDLERVAQTIFVPLHPCLSLALDSHGVPHIVHTPTEGAAMNYWTKVGDNWVSEPLPVGTWGQIAIDANDGLHLVFYDQSEGDLEYGTRSGAGWSFQSIDWITDVGKTPSLALDALGHPHVSYYDVTDQSLRYATREGGTWRRQFVDRFGDVGSVSSIAIGSNGMPSIAYYEDGRSYLKLATGQAPTPTKATSWGAVKALYNKR